MKKEMFNFENSFQILKAEFDENGKITGFSILHKDNDLTSKIGILKISDVFFFLAILFERAESKKNGKAYDFITSRYLTNRAFAKTPKGIFLYTRFDESKKTGFPSIAFKNDEDFNNFIGFITLVVNEKFK